MFWSCRNKNPKTSVDIDGVITISLSSMEEVLEDTSCFNKPQIITLETTEESLLSKIDRICMDDNTFFILDRNLMEVFSFDVTGKYLNKISYRGQGPREYVQISDFAIDTKEKQIVLLCNIPNKLMYYSYDGAFIKEENLNVYYKELAIESDYIYFEIMNNEGMEAGHIAILDKETNKIQESLEQIDIENYFFIDGNSLNKGGNISFVRRFDNSIYGIDNGVIIKKYNIDFRKHSFPDRLIKENSTDEILKECSENKYIFSMANVVNSNRYMIFKTNLGIALYDKKNDLLKGYNEIQNMKWDTFFYHFIPIENTDKIVCSIDDPTYLKHAVEHLSEKEKKDERFVEIINIANQLTDENNPILFIYEFKD